MKGVCTHYFEHQNALNDENNINWEAPINIFEGNKEFRYPDKNYGSLHNDQDCEELNQEHHLYELESDHSLKYLDNDCLNVRKDSQEHCSNLLVEDSKAIAFDDDEEKVRIVIVDDLSQKDENIINSIEFSIYKILNEFISNLPQANHFSRLLGAEFRMIRATRE